MNKSVLVAAILAASVGMSGSVQSAAHDPLITWQGAATITALTSQCSSIGFTKGDTIHSIYRPNLDAAEPHTAITFISSRSAIAFFQKSGNKFMHGEGTYSGAFIGGRATIRPSSTSAAPTGNFDLTVSPTSFTASTTTNVDIKGSLTNFFGTTGCTVTFSASYQRRP